jgi:hypothetical protein
VIPCRGIRPCPLSRATTRGGRPNAWAIFRADSSTETTELPARIRITVGIPSALSWRCGTVFAFLESALPLAFVVTWVGVGIVLFIRTRVKQNAFLRRLGHQIDFSTGDPIFFPRSYGDYREIKQAMHRQQPNPETESLRRDMWRRFHYFRIWVFGFPVLVVGVAALFISQGWIRVL